MLDRTQKLWELQNRHGGDRQRLFGAVAEFVEVSSALYPGSYVDLAPSFVWPSVTYVDVDRRAAQFFSDEDGVNELLEQHGVDPMLHSTRFVKADYRDTIDVDDGSFDLLISLYAGFITEHCTRYLRIGGSLLVNPSHGDAAMASIDERYELRGVVVSRSGAYSVTTEDLDGYFVPKRGVVVSKEMLHSEGRGIAYTKSPFAYLFERVS
jgi:hypothetical protein